MPSIDDLIAQESDAPSSLTPDIDKLVAGEIAGRERAKPLGDPIENRQAVADSNLLNISMGNAISGKQDIDRNNNPELQESRRVGAAAVENYLATLSPAERRAMPGSEHLDSDFPEFPGLEDVQAPFAPRGEEVTPTLGGRPGGTISTRLTELGLTREFFANIPEMVKETFKQQAGGISLAAGEQLGQDLSWRSRLGRLAGAVAGPAVTGVEAPTDILPGPLRVAKELGDWATDAIAQGFGVDSSLVEGGQQLRDEALTRIAELQPAEKTFLQEVITSGTQSAALALPGMAISMITRNPTALLAAFGASTYGDSYGTARDAGKSPEESHQFALRDAAIEVGTEIGPAKIMLGASKTAIRQTLIRLFKSEMGGETLATIGQKVNSAMSGVETMPLDQWMGELWHELKVTWATTAILTPLQGATAKLAGQAIDKIGREDISGELESITPEESAAIDQKAARAGKALKAAMFTTAGVAETELDLSDEQVQKFIDQPELSDISETDLDAIIGDEANEEALISALVDRVSGEEIAAIPEAEAQAEGEQLDAQLSEAATVEEERAVYDRRNEKLREIAVKDMTPEQKDRALLLNDLTHIPNRRAYSEDMAAESHPVQVAIDLDSLKWINDNGGHQSGDELLGAMASAVEQVAKEFGIKGYHFSGDEFALTGENAENTENATIALHQLLENAIIEITDEEGNTIKTGVTFGFGTDQSGDFKNADARLIQEKDRSKELGEKADRGEVPRNVQVVDSEGQVLSADDTASYFESIESQRRAEAKGKPKLSDPLAESIRRKLDPKTPPAAISGESLSDFSDRWEENGVDNSVSESKGIITLSAVQVPKDDQGQGIGSQYISELISYADQTGQKIALTPSKDFGATSVSRLKTFYKRFGFVENKGRNRDFSHLEDMYRDPLEAQLEPFSPDQIESVPLREAVESGLISEDEGSVIDGFLESLPESLRESFDVVFSSQEFEPTEAQLKAHDLEGAKGQVVRGALLESIKNEARDTIVMFGGSDITTFFHEFGELSYKRLLTSDERKYVADLKTQAGSKAAPNEWFSDQLQSFMVQEKETVFKPKLQEILSRIADTIRKIWARIRTAHRTPALDEIFRDILAGQREIIVEPVDPDIRAAIGERKKSVKSRIRAITGQAKPEENLIRESKALEASFKKAEQASKKAFREGNKSGVAAEKKRMETIDFRLREIKNRIRIITGQTRIEQPTVTETEALKAAFTKAAQAARAAERAGDKQGVAKEKARMKAILESAKERKQAQELRAKALGQIKKELKTTKVKKQAGKPRGKFTADIQEIFNTLRADLKLNKVEAFNKIAQNLEDHKDNIPPYSIAIENRLLSVLAAHGEGIGRLEFARIQQQGIENLLTEIKGLKGVGLSAREAQVSARVTEITDAREKVIDLVGGIPEGINAVGEEGVTLKGLAGIKQGIRNALIAGRTNSVVGWKDLLDIISFHDKTSKPGESAISKFGDVLDANNAEKQGNINSMSAFRAITFEAYGLDNDSDMVKKFTQDAVIHDLGEFKTLNDVFVKLRMTRAEARKRAMEIMDPTLHDTIFTPEGMGWTQDMADAVFDFLTPQDEDFITKQLEFYQKYYESINEVYSIIYGVNLPKNINYSPIAREGISQDVESTLGEFFNEISLRASAETAGGLKSRVASKLPLRPQSDISVIQQHVADMEHFKAWSEKIRDLNAVFGNSEVRQAIRVNFGDKIDGEIQRFIIDMAKGGADTSKRMATLDRMMGKYARSVLAIKPSIFLKQLTSTVAYADSIPAAYWTKEAVKIHEIPKFIDMLFDKETGSTLVKHRWEKGAIERDISNAMKSSEFAALTVKPSFFNMLMFNVKFGDMGAIIIGGYPVYKYHRTQGLSHEEALKRFESVTESTQQSADISQQSSWQRGGSFAKLFTMFMSSPNQYLRKEIGAIRNFAAGRMDAKQFAKTMLIYHIILPMFFQLASDRFVWAGDEDEEALIPQVSGEQKRAMILGSLNGFFIVGDALEAVISKSLDLKIFGFENPLWSIVNDALKAWPLLDWDDIDHEDFIKALRGLAGASGAAAGLPAKQAVDIVTGFNKTISGEYETGVAQMMGWSPHQAEKAAERE